MGNSPSGKNEIGEEEQNEVCKISNNSPSTICVQYTNITIQILFILFVLFIAIIGMTIEYKFSFVGKVVSKFTNAN